MKNSSVTATAGWLALRLMPAGSLIALALLGVAVTLHDGMASDEEINDWYEDLAGDSDPVFTVNEHYVLLERAYPHLEGWLGPLTAWTEFPQMSHADLVRSSADVLRTVQWTASELWAQGDLLGRVQQEMNSIGARRLTVFDFTPPSVAVLDLIVQDFDPRRLNSFADIWCGSGTRVIAMTMLMHLYGMNPASIPWRLNDPNTTSLALAGLNTVGVQLGHQVTLSNDRAWAEKWAASSAHRPFSLQAIPPEDAEFIKGLRRKS